MRPSNGERTASRSAGSIHRPPISIGSTGSSADAVRGAPAVADTLIIIASKNHLDGTAHTPASGVVCQMRTRLDGRAPANPSGRPVSRGSQAANAIAHIDVWISRYHLEKRQFLVANLGEDRSNSLEGNVTHSDRIVLVHGSPGFRQMDQLARILQTANLLA